MITFLGRKKTKNRQVIGLSLQYLLQYIFNHMTYDIMYTIGHIPAIIQVSREKMRIDHDSPASFKILS